ncbi:DUF1190 domain-containing protein [Parvularcula oceani]|uniref:DUF1190 domain-containing protein n=1 Tax=Parvularcula oceani TaxID=1247963 RepID=UPI0004E1CE7C|nr:DUF1190 domain-containing protein [Parvularcula oceani]
MKRSRAVPLVLMGAAAACESPEEAARRDAPPAPTFPTEQACLDTGVFARAACGELVVPEGGEAPPAEARDYASVAECQADDYFQDDYCVAKYEEAVALHQDYGPAYSDLSACEADYGAANCGRQPVAQAGGGGGFWTPFLTGYLISSAINDFTRPQPYYRDPYGGYRTLGGYGFRGGRGGTYVPASAYRQTQRATTGRTNVQKAQAGNLRATPQRAQARRTTVARRGGFGGRSGGRGG